ncbi:MAG: uroporphyrinogen-III C-methyltransferase, partial [Myxococcales bacterium]
MVPGKVYLVGAGPGHPGLITVRGREVLGRAEVLVYDALADDRFLLMAPPGIERIYAGKREGDHGIGQDGINRLLVEKAREGRRVVRLKGGDPFVFGRGGEECEALAAAGIPFEIVPGLTAGLAATAYAGIPATHRDVSAEVDLVTAHRAADWEAEAFDHARVARAPGTVVLYMGVKTLADTARGIVAAGRAPSTPVAVIEQATRARQRVVMGTLADIAAKAAEADIRSPAVTVI